MVPVDLNAFLYEMEQNLADFAAVLGHVDDEAKFRTAAAARATAIRHLMYSASEGETWTVHNLRQIQLILLPPYNNCSWITIAFFSELYILKIL